MARKRFKPEEIVGILREAERGAGRKVLFRKHGTSEQTFYSALDKSMG
jgi:putative transposase